jgi:hypothetical protein
MERNYTKEELESKNLIELRIIAENNGLKISGKKQELIDRILNNQRTTYFNLLPPDIRKELVIYKQYAELNYEILMYIYEMFLERTEINDEKDAEKYADEINNIFKKHNSKSRIGIIIIFHNTEGEPVFSYNIDGNRKDNISDQLLLDLFDYFMSGDEGERPNFIENKMGSTPRLNRDLIEKNSKIRLIPILDNDDEIIVKAILEK